MDKQESLEQLSREISEKKAEVHELVDVGECKKARRVTRELEKLNNKFGKLKAEIGKESITEEDVQKLRSIEPHRKSVQNMTDLEVAQTPKFEKLLYTELGAKSPYEMRNGNTDWRNDTTKTVKVVNVQKRDIPEKLTLIKKDIGISKGHFVNRDTNIEIQFGKKAINEIVEKAIPDNKRGIPVEARMGALYQMQELIENAICFDSQISEASSRSKSTNTLFMHRMYGVYTYDNKLFLANFAVEEFYSRNDKFEMTKTANRLYSLRDIKITPVKLLGLNADANLQDASRDTSTGVTTISIPQLYEFVKTYDNNFFENPKAVGREEREVEQFRNAQFEDAKAELESGNPTSSAAESVIDKYARERGLTADEAAERLINQAEKFKLQRDILRGKIDEVNEILEENPALKEEYRAKRDEHRERLESKSISTDEESRPTSPKPTGSKH